MSDQYILIHRKPVPCDDLLEWGRQLKEVDRRVAQTDVGPGIYWVSTVFLGLDHNFSGKGPPLLFETMIFKTGESTDLYMNRYSTWEEAEAGHLKAVEKAKEML